MARTRAIGGATAEAGARLLAHYARSAQEAESLVAGIPCHRGRADAIRADLGTSEGATLLAKEVRSFAMPREDTVVLRDGLLSPAKKNLVS
jgi:3-oxoacyl-[acyl-carrier protein] reductase